MGAHWRTIGDHFFDYFYSTASRTPRGQNKNDVRGTRSATSASEVGRTLGKDVAEEVEQNAEGKAQGDTFAEFVAGLFSNKEAVEEDSAEEELLTGQNRNDACGTRSATSAAAVPDEAGLEKLLM